MLVTLYNQFGAKKFEKLVQLLLQIWILTQ